MLQSPLTEAQAAILPMIHWKSNQSYLSLLKNYSLSTYIYFGRVLKVARQTTSSVLKTVKKITKKLHSPNSNHRNQPVTQPNLRQKMKTFRLNWPHSVLKFPPITLLSSKL